MEWASGVELASCQFHADCLKSCVEWASGVELASCQFHADFHAGRMPTLHCHAGRMPTLHFHAGRMPTLLLFSAKTDATPPVPDSRFPFPSWEGLGVGSDSRFPIPVPLLGGVRGGFRFPIPDSRSPPGRG
ncbi:hypothetical protein [Moorena sp. SIO3A2]|uniref:hypothetical protein n=1 Tax=Moorena sp. SIO3A2 TaxID=2607841 RepID=UPI0013BAFE23|nr:hypothetical protein [Moorena sp. SIO3A2]NER91054.1 hypothetical protein [Moorena sp. SIO3A2]